MVFNHSYLSDRVLEGGLGVYQHCLINKEYDKTGKGGQQSSNSTQSGIEVEMVHPIKGYAIHAKHRDREPNLRGRCGEGQGIV